MIRKIGYAFIFVFLLCSHAVAQPSSYNWRDVGGVNYVTPVKDQGSCSTCWAFAATAQLESKAIIDGVLSLANANLSEQVMVSCSGAGQCYGSYSDQGPVATYIRDYGLPVESCLPYVEGTCCQDCSGACATYQTQTYRITSWAWVSPITVANIKSAIYNYGPVVVTFKFYLDLSRYTSGIYYYNFEGHACNVEDPCPTYGGKHDVLVVGYNDTGSYFIVKNSWGEDWGESGYFRIAYTEVGGTTDFGNSTIRYGTASDSVAPNPPSNLRITQ